MPPLYRRHPRIRALAQDDPRIRAVAQDDLSNEQTQLSLLPLSFDYANPDCSGNCCRRQSACVIGRRLHGCLGCEDVDESSGNEKNVSGAKRTESGRQEVGVDGEGGRARRNAETHACSAGRHEGFHYD